MTRDPDAYAIWGDWDLDQFKVQIARWRDTTHPPAIIFALVDQWWHRLRQPLEWSNCPRVSPANDPAGNLRWIWVPGGDWDELDGRFRVQCFFRTHQRKTPPRLECIEFVTVPALSPVVSEQEGQEDPPPQPR